LALHTPLIKANLGFGNLNFLIMDKMYKLTVVAPSEEEAKIHAIEEGAIDVISVDEINRIYEVVVIKKS
jgi:hypothetical protein